MSAPRLNIFLDNTVEKKGIAGSGDSKSHTYSPNVVLDLRLEVDRLRSEVREKDELIEHEMYMSDKLRLENVIWKIEAARLNHVCEDLTERCKLMQEHLQEATRLAGAPGEREKDLEEQLESIL